LGEIAELMDQDDGGSMHSGVRVKDNEEALHDAAIILSDCDIIPSAQPPATVRKDIRRELDTWLKTDIRSAEAVIKFIGQYLKNTCEGRAQHENMRRFLRKLVITSSNVEIRHLRVQFLIMSIRSEEGESLRKEYGISLPNAVFLMNKLSPFMQQPEPDVYMRYDTEDGFPEEDPEDIRRQTDDFLIAMFNICAKVVKPPEQKKEEIKIAYFQHVFNLSKAGRKTASARIKLLMLENQEADAMRAALLISQIDLAYISILLDNEGD